MKKEYEVTWVEYRKAYVMAESKEEAIQIAEDLDDANTELFNTDYWEAELMEGSNETK